jgi:predicted transcriptional regulator
MKRFVRRDRMKIYGDILSVIASKESEKDEQEIPLTHIQLMTNVPFDRLKIYLSELKQLGLIQAGSSPKITKKGEQFLFEYEKVLDFMKRMGLGYQR